VPDKERKIKFKLQIENIGPHFGDKCISFSEDMDSLKAVIFATNGVGKSFVSRTFRLLSPDVSDYDTDELLTLNKNAANMKLSIIRDTVNKELQVNLHRGALPEIKNDTGLVFHIFNSEYVKENIEPNNYTHDGNIEGYILGKVQIDLTEEKKKEAVLKDEINSIDKEITKEIERAQRILRDNGIQRNLNEYALVSKEKLLSNEVVSCDKPFSEIKVQLETLKNLPDDLPDIITPQFIMDDSVLSEAKSILETHFQKSDLDEEVATRIKSKRGFVEQGIELSGEANTCPFCMQIYSDSALSLIDKYKEFLLGNEAVVIKQIEKLIKEIETLISGITGFIEKTSKENNAAQKLVMFFPSLEGTELLVPELSLEDLSYFHNIIRKLINKTQDISVTYNDINSSISECKQILNTYREVSSENLNIALKINELKNDSNMERRNLRRDLCKAQFILLQSELEYIFGQLSTKRDLLSELVENIKIKEENVRILRRDKFYDTLTFFLNRFFAGKYAIDKESFMIKFLNTTHPKASSILSDGEKSIVAFCFYMASTHLLTARDDDYNKLFFIIDDPVSSMDFHHVYAVAQSICEIKSHFGISTHDRIFVFTHNLEFFSIITRNKVITNMFTMKPGKIIPMHENLILPYEHHLQDIVKVAREQTEPSHTTGNSIRHVLETVSRFEYPNKSLIKYISEKDELNDNSCIYNLCQDLSHGAYRTQIPYDEQVIMEACKTVLKFMERQYLGQIEAVT